MITRRKLLKSAATAAGMAGMFSWPLKWSVAKELIHPDEKSVLIVVDVQNCFTEGGTLPVPDGAAVIPVINRIAPVFSLIVITQDWHTVGHASFASAYDYKKPFDTVKLEYGAQVLWPDHCIQGTQDAAVHKALELPGAQLILRKGYHQSIDSYSAFTEADRKTTTGLGGYLSAQGIQSVFVTGLATDFCVAWTAIDARSAGFKTYVVEDACRAIDLNGSLAQAWEKMTHEGVKRIQSTDLALHPA